jgi:hypothetical protein
LPRNFTGDPTTDADGDGPRADHHLAKLRFQYTLTSFEVWPTSTPFSATTGRGPETVTLEPVWPEEELRVVSYAPAPVRAGQSGYVLVEDVSAALDARGILGLLGALPPTATAAAIDPAAMSNTAALLSTHHDYACREPSSPVTRSRWYVSVCRGAVSLTWYQRLRNRLLVGQSEDGNARP